MQALVCCLGERKKVPSMRGYLPLQKYLRYQTIHYGTVWQIRNLSSTYELAMIYEVLRSVPIFWDLYEILTSFIGLLGFSRNLKNLMATFIFFPIRKFLKVGYAQKNRICNISNKMLIISFSFLKTFFSSLFMKVQTKVGLQCQKNKVKFSGLFLLLIIGTGSLQQAERKSVKICVTFLPVLEIYSKWVLLFLTVLWIFSGYYYIKNCQIKLE